MYKIKKLIRTCYYFFTEKHALQSASVFVREVKDTIIANDVLKTSASFIYYTLVTAVPFLALFVPVLNMLGSIDSFYMVIERILGTVIGEEYAHTLANQIASYASNTVSLGVVSILVFFASSILLINRIYTEINSIYKTPRTKDKDNLFKRFFSYVVFLIVFIIFVSVFLFSISKIIATVDEELHFISLSWLYKLFTSNIFRIIMVFLVIYGAISMIPRVYVNGRSALYGTIFAEIGIFVLSVLLRMFVNVLFRKSSIIYGSVASLFVFLFWLYWMWNIFLIGVIISYVSQYHPEESKSTEVPISSRIERGINMMSILGISFMNATGGVNLSTLASELHLPSYEIISIADKFIDGGLIYPIGKLKNRVYCLAIPPEKISIYYMVKLIMGSGESHDVGGKVVEELDKNLAEVTTTKTLAELL